MKYPQPVEDMILDALDELSKVEDKSSWQNIKFAIHRFFGVWVKETTLVRTLRRMAEHGDIDRDERGHFWK